MNSDAIKQALQSMWEDTCAVYERQPVRQPNGTTIFQTVLVLENVPCKLSFETLQPVNQTATAAQLVQTVKLFLDVKVDIRAGSKIVVYRDDRVFEFSSSGLPGVFDYHQEIMLRPFNNWA